MSKRVTAPSPASSGLRFLISSEGDTTSRPTVCWLKREPGLALDAWSLHLTPPGGDATVVEDIKQWALFGEDDYRFLDPTGSSAAGDLRRYGRYDVLTKYLRAVCDSLPAEALTNPWCLMPAVADSARRKAYTAAIHGALPNAKILHEPEMVLEYFRLVRREVTLESGRHGIFLIIDAGASTTNFTVVISNIDDTVTTAETARARPKSLDAKIGNAPKYAGKWIDTELANLLGWSTHLRALPRASREGVLSAIEDAKVRASASGTSAGIAHPHAPAHAEVTGEALRAAARSLWARLQPTYLEVVERFLADIRKGKHGRPILARLSEMGVDDAAGVHRAIDAVFLAGGTSQLPGFQQAMLAAIFPDQPGVSIYAVGSAYKTAAAVGALAHIVDQTYTPSRLHVKKGVDAPDSLAVATFNGTPSTDIVWAWRRGDDPEEKLILIERTDDLLVDGGERDVVDVPNFDLGTALRARLIPGDELSRVGLGMRALTVTGAPVTAKVLVSKTVREVRLQSPELSGTHGLVLDLNQRRSIPPKPARKRDPRVRLWSDGAPDVVIDLGMSKTVVVKAEEGPFELDVAPASETTAGLAVVAAPAEPATDQEVPGAPGEPAATDTSDVSASPIDPPRVDDTPAEPAPPASPPPPSPPSTPGPARPPHAGAAGAPTVPDDAGGPPVLAQSPAQFGEQLRGALQELIDAGMGTTAADLAMLLLALAVRPFVLLAGPPGSGKSTLVRTAAKVLGLVDGVTFHDIPIQPHWRSHDDIPAAVREGLLGTRGLSMCLFDEVNLTPAENYLMPLFKRLDGDSRGDVRLLLCGTLNIDDASRPPSPKIVDRSFFLSIDAPLDERVRDSPRDLVAVGAITALPTVVSSSPVLHGRAADVVRLMQTHVRGGNLRPDLLPSLRDIRDLERLAATYEACELGSLLPQDDLDDQAIAGRLLTKVAGAADQVGSLVEALREHFDSHPTLHRCRRAMAVAQAQLRLGFVSPWQ